MKTLILFATLVMSASQANAGCNVLAETSQRPPSCESTFVSKKITDSGHKLVTVPSEADFEIKATVDIERRNNRKVVRYYYLAIDHRNAGVELARVLVDEDNIRKGYYDYSYGDRKPLPPCNRRQPEQAMFDEILLKINAACAQ